MSYYQRYAATATSPAEFESNDLVACVECGSEHDYEDDRNDTFVELEDETIVCTDKCQYAYKSRQFAAYLKEKNVADRLAAIMQNPTNAAVLALKSELVEAATWGKEVMDYGSAECVLGALFDAEYVIEHGMGEIELQIVLDECLEAVRTEAK